VKGSRAAEEIDQNAALASDASKTPVTDAYSIGSMQHAAAGDHLLSLERLLKLEVRPMRTPGWLPIPARAHTEAPGNLANRETRAGAILPEHVGERRHRHVASLNGNPEPEKRARLRGPARGRVTN
jgi:hypothetical protein